MVVKIVMIDILRRAEREGGERVGGVILNSVDF
jgi:hypothetical protein